jgi:2-hydroxychromene-2-carboxylate isomerase
LSQVEFWFEFASTYSYPAAFRIEALARSAGVEVLWRAFLLERICAALGLPLRRPSQFPRNGLLAARLACQFAEAPWLPEFVRQVYKANFAEDRDIADPAVIASILKDLDQPAGLISAAESPEAKAKLRAHTERARELGIFGAPTVSVGSELFWGNDRLETAIAWATAPQS